MELTTQSRMNFFKNRYKTLHIYKTILSTFYSSVFGDTYITSIEETWYKAAVLQHMIEKQSLVIATKLPSLDEIITTDTPVQNLDGDITITASYAIFYKDGDSETPASVVGFEYSFQSFYDRFLEITETGRGKSDVSIRNFVVKIQNL